MAVAEWRALGIFGLLLLGLTFVDARFAWWLLAAFAAVVLLTYSGRIAGLVEKGSG